jgi:hypothetical protein
MWGVESKNGVGKTSAELNFNSEKKLLLVNVLDVLDIRKNLVSANLLCKKGFKAILKSNKIILLKNRLFVRKCYSCDRMFKLGINNKVNVSIYMIELSLSLWHDHLTYFSFRSLKNMAKHNLISYNIEDKRTCEIYIQEKITRKTFSKVEKNINLLELVHSDICELNDILTR